MKPSCLYRNERGASMLEYALSTAILLGVFALGGVMLYADAIYDSKGDDSYHNDTKGRAVKSVEVVSRSAPCTEEMRNNPEKPKWAQDACL